MPHSDYLSSIYRLDGYSPRLHLSVYVPLVAASGTLTATPSNPTTTLAVSFAVGSETDVQAGFLIRIRDTATQGVKGYTRVRYTGTPTSSSIPVRELSFAANIQCASGDTFEVLRYVPLDTKLTTADVTFSPDGIPYVAQGSNPPPLVCSGGNSVRWVDSGQTYGTVTTAGGNTSLVDPDSATPPTHLWTLPTGVAFASGSANTNTSPVLEANVGSWLVKHVATDPDNSQAATQWTHHVVHDADHPPYDCLLTDYSGDHQDGINWTVEVLDDAVTEDDIFPLALCFLWVDDYFIASGSGAVTNMHRSAVTGRSQILGMGYARRVTMQASGEDGIERVTFDIQSPLARLQEIASYSKVMLEAASPDEWNEQKTLGFWRGIVQDWMFYTTGTESGGDFVKDASFSDARYPAHYLQRSDPISQIRELADARQGRLVQRDWGARFEAQYHPGLLPLDDRLTAVIDWTLTSADVFDFEMSIELADSTELFQQEGVTAGADGNQSTFSRVGIGGGKNAETLPRKSPDGQAMNNDWAGMSYALREGIFVDADGIRYRVGDLTLDLPGQYLVADFDANYHRFDYQGKRVDFSRFLFWLKSFSFEVDADTGASYTRFVFAPATAAPAGATFVPDPGTTTPTDGQPTPYPFPPTQPITPLAAGTGHLGFVDSNGYLYYTTTANGAEPEWSRLNLSLDGATQDFVANPFCPLYLNQTGNVELYAATTTRIYKIAWNPDSPSSATVTSQLTFADPDADAARIETERGFEGVVGVMRTFFNSETVYHGTTNGATWSIEFQVSADGYTTQPGLFISPRVAGKIVTSTQGNSDVVPTTGQVSSSNGASFTTMTSPNLDAFGPGAGGLHYPFHNNHAESTAYFGTIAGGVRDIYRADGATQTPITPSPDHWTERARSIDSSPVNAACVVVCASNASEANVYASRDRGATWTLVDDSATFYNARYSGNDPNIFWVTGDNGALAIASQDGALRSLMGNLSSFSSPAVGTVHNIFGF